MGKNRYVKSVQIRSYFWSVISFIRTEYGDLLISLFSPNTGKYGPEITPYLDTFHAVIIVVNIPHTGHKLLIALIQKTIFLLGQGLFQETRYACGITKKVQERSPVKGYSCEFLPLIFAKLGSLERYTPLNCICFWSFLIRE